MPLQFTWTDFPELYDDDSLVKKLRFKKNFSSDFQNLLIEGDNYPVLKILGEGVADFPNLTGAVDIIYIDPPYNTGNDFTYNDNFYVREAAGETGSPRATTIDRHSQWLSFMHRRLSAARPLLKQTGCIFIAIDQSELYTLKLLCDQIFGEENFVNDFMWLHGKGKKDRWSRTLQQHTLCYARCKAQLPAFREVQQTGWATTNADNDPRGNWFSGSISFTEKRSNHNHKNYYSITSPSGKVWTRQWQTSEEEMKKLIEDNRIYWGTAPLYDKVPRVKIFNGDESEVIPRNIIEEVETTRAAQNHLDSLLERPGAFDNPKPVSLIKHLIEITRQPSDSLILDFFAGSGTTFESVCALNAQDGGHRCCILVQKDENGIAELCQERCHRTAAQYGVEMQFSSLEA